jgi:expansin (peptidoglycan-binding protein)
MTTSAPPAGADIQPTDGTATFTDLTGGGACSFPGEPPDNLHVGISTAEFGTADVCGAYLDVRGPKGSVRVLVTDHCTNCRPGVVDVSRKAFTRIADVGAGQAPVHYQLVRNPPLARPISLLVRDGSSTGWFQLQVLDHGNALAGVELGTTTGHWRRLTRSPDNYWTAANPGPGAGPFTIRITDVYDQAVELYDVRLAPGEVQHTVARLYQPASPGTGNPAPVAAPVPAPAAPDDSPLLPSVPGRGPTTSTDDATASASAGDDRTSGADASRGRPGATDDAQADASRPRPAEGGGSSSGSLSFVLPLLCILVLGAAVVVRLFGARGYRNGGTSLRRIP